MTTWTRPTTLEFPKVWVTFEGKGVTSSGTKQKFWIQDVTDDYKEEIIHYIITGYLKDTPIYRYSKFTDDPQSVEDYVTMWRKILDQNVSLICLTQDGRGQTSVVGFNIYAVLHKNANRNLVEIMKGRVSKMVAGTQSHIWNIKDIFTELNIDFNITSWGLYVLPEFRLQGIAYELLKAGREIAVALGINVSVTLFTSFGGQSVAERVGFRDITKCSFEDFERVNPLFKFPGIEADSSKAMRLMYIRYSDS
ncbi:hypothetical protein NQ318_004796 [Aromia moschata]|uniref:N-acetyltransferase domain-containing protein n=1 Tax=Aromia moschata TaxID=1265417 RepID=A0AAV8XNT1_9CUCU|nr:hypothetical protein NQ318_004796 [Aromia moschata]